MSTVLRFILYMDQFIFVYIFPNIFITWLIWITSSRYFSFFIRWRLFIIHLIYSTILSVFSYFMLFLYCFLIFFNPFSISIISTFLTLFLSFFPSYFSFLHATLYYSPFFSSLSLCTHTSPLHLLLLIHPLLYYLHRHTRIFHYRAH